MKQERPGLILLADSWRQIDEVVDEVILTHFQELLPKPIRYVVSAIWGADKEKEIDQLQKRINRRTEPIVRETIEALMIPDLSGDQQYALGYLIRGLMVSRIGYLIEKLKVKLLVEASETKKTQDVTEGRSLWPIQ